MYMRYFMWNFAGRSSDIQDADWLRPWESSTELPDVIADNNARNNFFMLPLIFGLIGMFFHYQKHRKGFWVVAMLFFLTGIALILYLNSPPIEPRERDYIYVGSFYAFAMWIGLAVMALYDAAKNLKWEELGKLAVYPFGAGIVIYLFELLFGGDSGGSFSIIYMSVVWAGVMALMILARTLIQKDKALIGLATVLCLIVPSIMMAQGWNDHDRSDRYFSVDSAKNYLASCAPNAILFTGGDNDTFPLWYAQEVEGFRTDVRVIVLTYFATDWYNEQMRRSTYGSTPLPFTLNSHDYRQGGPNDYLPVTDDPRIKGQAIDLKQYLQLVTEQSKVIQYPTGDDYVNLIPARKMFLKVDTTKVISEGLLPENLRPYLTDRLLIDIKGNAIYKNDLGILDIIATNQWERPIYFNQTSLINTKLRLDPYVVQEGATYRLLPVFNPDPMRRSLVNTDVMYDNMMNKFHWRELDNPDVYYTTEDYLDKAISVHRSYFNTLARALIDDGKTDQAKEVLLKSLELIPDEVVAIRPYSAQMIQMLIEVGEVEQGTQLANKLTTRIDKYLTYLEDQGINDQRQSYLNFTALRVIDQALTEAGKTEDADKVKALMTKYVPTAQP
ncbi:MAG: tetratricopeptide repeat protein, partial [Cyclobacteriaceae bacterium]